MRSGKKMLLAAGLMAGAAMMTGCSANTRPVTTPTPGAQQVTSAPATAQPAAESQQMQPTEADTPGDSTPIPLTVAGEEISEGAMEESGKLLLPLEETAKALGWKAQSEETEAESQVQRVVTLEKGESRITVSWTVSDNTAKSITWQKDGLLVPVDTHLTTVNEIVYVPSAFFEKAMDVTVQRKQNGVSVTSVEPEDTPEKQEQPAEGNG